MTPKHNVRHKFVPLVHSLLHQQCPTGTLITASAVSRWCPHYCISSVPLVPSLLHQQCPTGALITASAVSHWYPHYCISSVPLVPSLLHQQCPIGALITASAVSRQCPAAWLLKMAQALSSCSCKKPSRTWLYLSPKQTHKNSSTGVPLVPHCMLAEDGSSIKQL